eukprot:COSAG06_NODE_5604_length_3367_cov_2.060588_1_plen_101_part_10
MCCYNPTPPPGSAQTNIVITAPGTQYAQPAIAMASVALAQPAQPAVVLQAAVVAAPQPQQPQQQVQVTSPAGVPAGKKTRLLRCHSMLKRSFYQDRLGTNI